VSKLLKLFLAALIALVASIGLAACGDDDDDEGGGTTGGAEGGSITISQTSQPDYLDPALSYTVNGWEPMWLVYTPPVTYARAEGEAGTELIPGVAEELPEVSEDGRTYTFTIREGLQYSDGSQVKASDFEHTIKRVLNLESGGSAFYEVIEGATEYIEAGDPEGDISGIEANDRSGEVTIKLTERSGSFLNVLGMNFAGIVPGDTPFRNLSKEPPPGVGPYMITESVPNRQFVMERNPNFDIPDVPKGNIDTITTEIIKSAERQTQDVINGELDFMQDPPPADLLPEVREQYSDRYEEHTPINTYYFFMNVRTPPFDKEEVRRAVNLAVDSNALARLFGGRLEPSCNFLPEGLPGHEPIDPCPFGDPAGEADLEEARRLIKDAGVEGEKVTAYTNNDENRPEIGQYLTDLLNQIGFDADLEIIDGGVYFATIGNEETAPQIGFLNWYQDFPHPANFLFLVDSASIQPTNSQNIGNVSDPELDKLIDQANAGPASDESVREAAAQADQLLIDKSYVAPYGQEAVATFMSERMDFENCSLFHPVYQNDYSSFCLKE
jgi:peptide/nickel transport system substrate-binding protein